MPFAAWKSESALAEPRQCEHFVSAVPFAVAELYDGPAYRTGAQSKPAVSVVHHLPHQHPRLKR